MGRAACLQRKAVSARGTFVRKGAVYHLVIGSTEDMAPKWSISTNTVLWFSGVQYGGGSQGVGWILYGGNSGYVLSPSYPYRGFVSSNSRNAKPLILLFSI